MPRSPNGSANMNSERNLLNIRPFLTCFLAMAAGIGFSYLVVATGAPLFFAASAFAFPILLPLFNQNKLRAAFVGFLAAALFFVGMLAFSVQYSDYFVMPLEDGVHLLSGRIVGKSDTDDGFLYVLSGIAADGAEIKGKLSFSSSVDLSCGSVVRFYAETQKNSSLFTYGYFYVNDLLSDVRYSARVLSDVSLNGFSYVPLAFLRERIYDVLFSVMEQSEASVCYALVTGDTSAVEYGLLSNIRYGGVAHIFAVSGLHIGVVYGGLRALLKRAKAARLVSGVVCLLVSFAYVALCGFTPSALRAFLMCVCADLSFYLRGNGDLSESVGFAGAVLLLYKSAYLFSIGFRLSFAATLGIAFFSEPFGRLLSKARIKGRLLSVLSLKFSVDVALFPILLDGFSYVSLWGFLLNIVVVPLLSLCFAPLLALILLGCAFPFAAGALLFLPKVVFGGLCFLFEFFDFSSLAITGFSFGYAQIPYYACAFVASGKINLKRGARLFLCFFLFIVVVFLVVMRSF